MTITSFIFDVDGTLTPSRGVMDKEFKEFFLDFQSKNNVYLVTGSDRDKTLEQVGEDVYNNCKKVYNCSGNSVWIKDKNIYTTEWTLDEQPWKFLESKLLYSNFAPKTGWHFDVRPGMVNFSIVGRKATQEQRQQYIEWDEKTNERKLITDELNRYFGENYNVEATIGGETGIDISGVGLDKSQILKDFGYWDNIDFYGDKIVPGGNDWSLALALVNGKYSYGKAIRVKDWQDTWKILKINN